MPANPPENMPRITPAVFYDDPAAAIEWLTRVFGFENRLAIPGPDGGIVHAELQLADGVVMLGPTSADHNWKSPQSLGGAISQSLYVYVDDVDAHFAHARDEGAKIVSEPTDQFYGDRNYEARDLEGHRWSFGQHVKDIPLEEMQMPTS